MHFSLSLPTLPSLLQDYTNGQTKKSTSAHKQETTFGSESGQHRIPISDAHWQTVIMRLGFATTILIAAPFTPTAHDSCRPDGVLCISITAGSRAGGLGYRDGARASPGPDHARYGRNGFLLVPSKAAVCVHGIRLAWRSGVDSVFDSLSPSRCHTQAQSCSLPPRRTLP